MIDDEKNNVEDPLGYNNYVKYAAKKFIAEIIDKSQGSWVGETA